MIMHKLHNIIITVSLLVFCNSCLIDDSFLPESIRKDFEQERLVSSAGAIPDENENLDSSKFVNLGLPSGTIWCVSNSGATDMYDYGIYLSWTNAKNQIPKDLDMPSYEQAQELIDYCYWRWTMSGYLGVGPSGNSIFLPAGGEYYDPKDNYDPSLLFLKDMGCFWIDYDTTTADSPSPTAATIEFMYSVKREPTIRTNVQNSLVNIRCVKTK